jgi:AcrR family transcriptional regulator
LTLDTRTALINTAEALWADHGLTGVTFKQITKQAGCANTTAIQYHFKDREGLVYAIFASRAPILDRRRGDLYAAVLEDEKEQSLEALLNCVFRPFAEFRDEAGRRTFAAFVLSLARENRLENRFRTQAGTPHTTDLLGLIRHKLSHIDDAKYNLNMHLAACLYWNTLAALDHRPEYEKLTGDPEVQLLSRIIKQMARILEM